MTPTQIRNREEVIHKLKQAAIFDPISLQDAIELSHNLSAQVLPLHGNIYKGSEIVIALFITMFSLDRGADDSNLLERLGLFILRDFDYDIYKIWMTKQGGEICPK